MSPLQMQNPFWAGRTVDYLQLALMLPRLVSSVENSTIQISDVTVFPFAGQFIVLAIIPFIISLIALALCIPTCLISKYCTPYSKYNLFYMQVQNRARKLNAKYKIGPGLQLKDAKGRNIQRLPTDLFLNSPLPNDQEKLNIEIGVKKSDVLRYDALARAKQMQSFWFAYAAAAVGFIVGWIYLIVGYSQIQNAPSNFADAVHNASQNIMQILQEAAPKVDDVVNKIFEVNHTLVQDMMDTSLNETQINQSVSMFLSDALLLKPVQTIETVANQTAYLNTDSSLLAWMGQMLIFPDQPNDVMKPIIANANTQMKNIQSGFQNLKNITDTITQVLQNLSGIDCVKNFTQVLNIPKPNYKDYDDFGPFQDLISVLGTPNLTVWKFYDSFFKLPLMASVIPPKFLPFLVQKDKNGVSLQPGDPLQNAFGWNTTDNFQALNTTLNNSLTLLANNAVSLGRKLANTLEFLSSATSDDIFSKISEPKSDQCALLVCGLVNSTYLPFIAGVIQKYAGPFSGIVSAQSWGKVTSSISAILLTFGIILPIIFLAGTIALLFFKQAYCVDISVLLCPVYLVGVTYFGLIAIAASFFVSGIQPLTSQLQSNSTSLLQAGIDLINTVNPNIKASLKLTNNSLFTFSPDNISLNFTSYKDLTDSIALNISFNPIPFSYNETQKPTGFYKILYQILNCSSGGFLEQKFVDILNKIFGSQTIQINLNQSDFSYAFNSDKKLNILNMIYINNMTICTYIQSFFATVLNQIFDDSISIISQVLNFTQINSNLLSTNINSLFENLTMTQSNQNISINQTLNFAAIQNTYILESYFCKIGDDNSGVIENISQNLSSDPAEQSLQQAAINQLKNLSSQILQANNKYVGHDAFSSSDCAIFFTFNASHVNTSATIQTPITTAANSTFQVFRAVLQNMVQTIQLNTSQSSFQRAFQDNQILSKSNNLIQNIINNSLIYLSSSDSFVRSDLIGSFPQAVNSIFTAFFGFTNALSVGFYIVFLSIFFGLICICLMNSYVQFEFGQNQMLRRYNISPLRVDILQYCKKSQVHEKKEVKIFESKTNNMSSTPFIQSKLRITQVSESNVPSVETPSLNSTAKAITPLPKGEPAKQKYTISAKNIMGAKQLSPKLEGDAKDASKSPENKVEPNTNSNNNNIDPNNKKSEAQDAAKVPPVVQPNATAVAQNNSNVAPNVGIKKPPVQPKAKAAPNTLNQNIVAAAAKPDAKDQGSVQAIQQLAGSIEGPEKKPAVVQKGAVPGPQAGAKQVIRLPGNAAGVKKEGNEQAGVKSPNNNTVEQTAAEVGGEKPLEKKIPGQKKPLTQVNKQFLNKAIKIEEGKKQETAEVKKE